MMVGLFLINAGLPVLASVQSDCTCAGRLAVLTLMPSPSTVIVLSPALAVSVGLYSLSG